MKKQKTFTAPLKLKADGEPGEFSAVFATFNVEDLDGDVTVPGAFKEQPVLVEPWNHDRTLPTGKGTIKSDDNEAWIEGQFFLDTEAGKQTYKTVKNLGELAEWSYTFYIIQADQGQHEGNDVTFLREMDVIGVGPVNRGAGINTRTTDIKASKDDDNVPDDTSQGDDIPDDADDDDGEAESTESGDGGKPSGIGPQVVLAQIELIELETD